MCLYTRRDWSGKVGNKLATAPLVRGRERRGGRESGCRERRARREKGSLINRFMLICVKTLYGTCSLPFENRFPRGCTSRSRLNAVPLPGEMRHNDRTIGMKHLHASAPLRRYTHLCQLRIADLLTAAPIETFQMRNKNCGGSREREISDEDAKRCNLFMSLHLFLLFYLEPYHSLSPPFDF